MRFDYTEEKNDRPVYVQYTRQQRRGTGEKQI